MFIPTTVAEVFKHFSGVIEDLKEDIKKLKAKQEATTLRTKCPKAVEAMLRKISKSGRAEYTWDFQRASSFDCERNVKVTRNIIVCA